MAETMASFVIKLAQDPKLLEDFRKDPVLQMGYAGLSASEQEVLVSRDPKKIRDAIGSQLKENGGLAAFEYVVVLVNVHTTVRSIEANF